MSWVVFIVRFGAEKQAIRRVFGMPHRYFEIQWVKMVLNWNHCYSREFLKNQSEGFDDRFPTNENSVLSERLLGGGRGG